MAYETGGAAPVEVGFGSPEAQRRLTVLFRVVLIIPHAFILGILGLAAGLATIFGWFAALVTGRLPPGIANFVGGYVQYGARVGAYWYLMTDRYPPFEMNSTRYPVAVFLAPGPRLNRLAVLFRGILVIPAWFVIYLVQAGIHTALAFIWLIVLISGRMPGAIYQAMACYVRYYTRFTSYQMLLTPTYPGGLLGDRAPGPVTGPWEPAGAPPPSWTPGSPATTPLATRLVLSRAGRRTMILFLVLGGLNLLAPLGFGIAGGISGSNRASVALAQGEVKADFATLRGEVDADQTTIRSCGGDLNCVENVDRSLAGAFGSFGGQLETIHFPADARSDADRLARAALAMHASFLGAAGATDVDTYRLRAGPLVTIGRRFDTDYSTLVSDLSND